ncbi:MAG: MoaD/ThiS family protein [Caldilineaceae bacterium]
MVVRVRLYGALRRLSSPGTRGLWQGEVPAGLTIEGLILHLGTRPGEVYVASINGTLAPFETEIPDGAEVILAPPVGGGQPHPAQIDSRPCRRH